MTDAVRLFVNGLEEWPALADAEELVRRAAMAALAAGGAGRHGELSITFVSDDEIAGLNREWLGREGPTDVIAFTLGDGEELVGDVYIAPEVAARNAGELGIGPRQEALRLVIHGTLHVLGHDHPEGEERYASAMYDLQEELLRALERG